MPGPGLGPNTIFLVSEEWGVLYQVGVVCDTAKGRGDVMIWGIYNMRTTG